MKKTLSTGNPEGIRVFESSEFGSVRLFADAQGEHPMFNLADVCRALTLVNPARTKQRLSERGITTVNTPTRNQFGATVMQPMTYIDEANLYRCIFQSRKAEAENFQDWVFEEVLPQIRRTGGYIPTRNARTGERLTDEEIVDKALGIMQKTIEEVNGPAEACFTMTQLACEFGIEPKDLCSFLRDRGIIAWRKGRYCLQPRYQQQGYDDERLYCYFTRHGHSRSKPYLVWTPAGKRFVESIVNGKQVA